MHSRHSQAVFSSSDPDFINALAHFQSLTADQKEAFCREKCNYVCQGSDKDKDKLLRQHSQGVRHLNKLYLNYLSQQNHQGSIQSSSSEELGQGMEQEGQGEQPDGHVNAAEEADYFDNYDRSDPEMDIHNPEAPLNPLMQRLAEIYAEDDSEEEEDSDYNPDQESDEDGDEDDLVHDESLLMEELESDGEESVGEDEVAIQGLQIEDAYSCISNLRLSERGRYFLQWYENSRSNLKDTTLYELLVMLRNSPFGHQDLPSKRYLIKVRDIVSNTIDLSADASYAALRIESVLEFFLAKFSIHEMDFLPRPDSESVTVIQEALRFQEQCFSPLCHFWKDGNGATKILYAGDVIKVGDLPQGTILHFARRFDGHLKAQADIQVLGGFYSINIEEVDYELLRAGENRTKYKDLPVVIFPLIVFSDDFARKFGKVSPYDSLAIALACLPPDELMRQVNLLTQAVGFKKLDLDIVKTLLEQFLKQITSTEEFLILGKDGPIFVKPVPYCFVTDTVRAHQLCEVTIGNNPEICRRCLGIKNYPLRLGAYRFLTPSSHPHLSGKPVEGTPRSWAIARSFGISMYTHTPFDPLHVIDLGWVRHLWAACLTTFNQATKDCIAAAWASSSYSGLKQRTSRCIIRQHAQFEASDWRAFLEICVALLFICQVPEEMIALWESLCDLVKASVSRKITQPLLDSFPVLVVSFFEKFEAIPFAVKVRAQFLRRYKTHFMLHVAEDLKRFGPAVFFCASTFESLHRELRGVFRRINNRRICHFVVKKQFYSKVIGLLLPQSTPMEVRALNRTKRQDLEEIAAKVGLRMPLLLTYCTRFNAPVRGGNIITPFHSFSNIQIMQTQLFAAVRAIDGRMYFGVFAFSLSTQTVVIRGFSLLSQTGTVKRFSISGELIKGEFVGFVNFQHQCQANCVGRSHSLDGFYLTSAFALRRIFCIQ